MLLLSTASRILLFLYCVCRGHDTQSLSLLFRFGGTIKIGFCEHFLQNVSCKFIVLRRMGLPTTCVYTQPALHKFCNKACTAGLPHDTVVRCAAITNVQEMGFGCGVTFLSFLMIREMCSWGRVLGQQLSVDVAITRYSGVLSCSGVKGGSEGVGPGVPTSKNSSQI